MKTAYELNQEFIAEISNTIFLHHVERTFPNGEEAITILEEVREKLRALLDDDHKHKG